MSVADLELISEHRLDGHPNPLPGFLTEVVARLTAASINHAVAGMVAFGVHADARATDELEVIVLAKGSERPDHLEKILSSVHRSSVKLHVRQACREEDRQAVSAPDVRLLFGIDVRVVPADQLLWHLCRRDDLEAQILAGQLVASGNTKPDGVRRAMILDGAPDVVQRLEHAIAVAATLSQRTYGALRARQSSNRLA